MESSIPLTIHQWNGWISTWETAELRNRKGDDVEKKYGNEWKVVGFKNKRGEEIARRIPSNVLVREGAETAVDKMWPTKQESIDFYDGVTGWILRKGSKKTESAILRKVISELRIAHPRNNYNHLDATSLEDFERSYRRGTEWDSNPYYEFINLFSSNYEFKGLSMREHHFLMCNFATVICTWTPSPPRSDEDVEEYVQMSCNMRRVSLNAMTTGDLRRELILHMKIKNKQRELRHTKSTVYSEYKSLEEMANSMKTFEYDIPYMIETLIYRRVYLGCEIEPLLSEVCALDFLREKCDNGYMPRADKGELLKLDREDELYSKLASMLLLN